MDNQSNVVVVGAGIAGLTAARRISAAGRSVVVLEARDRVGGRTLNHTFADGTIVELGGQWVGPTQDRVLALLRELNIATFPTYDSGRSQVILATGAPAKVSNPKTFGLPPHVLAEVGLAQRRLEKMARTIPLDAPWTAPKALAWDGQTAESWIVRNLRTELGRSFWRAVVGAVFSCEARDVSFLHFLFYCHSGGLWDRLLGTGGGAQQDRVVGGSQVLCQRMAESLDVRLSTPVRCVTHSDTGVSVEAEGARWSAKQLIVAIPPHLIGRIDWQPGLGGIREQLSQNMPMGSVIKCQVQYSRAFWKDNDWSGQALSVVDPVSVIFDNSPPDGSCGVLLAFIEGKASHELRALSVEQRRDAVTKQLAKFFGPQARSPIDYAERDWAEETWTGGCYGGRMTPGVWTSLGHALRTPIGSIHWAGTETSDVWNGYFDGAVRSGERAAHEVLNR
jgi:monoamine oxidase